MINLQLGKTAEGTLELSTKVLQRDFACFGSSGSGKTVACKVMIEELARNGIPVIAFDPQGDIASLAILEDEEKLKDKSLNPVIRSIQFDLPENINVLLEVYDISGRLVEELHNRTMQAGYHSITWNATMYSSGIYFVKMVAGGQTNIQKLMLIK